MAIRGRKSLGRCALVGMGCIALSILEVAAVSAGTAPTAVASISAHHSALASACKPVRKKYPSLVGKKLTVATALEPGNTVADPSSPTGYKGLQPTLVRDLSDCLGFKYSFAALTFSGIIPAVQAGHDQFAIAGMYDTKAREKVVAFVDFEKVKEVILVPKGNPLHISSIAALCGHSASEATGYWTNTYLEAQSKKCTNHGKASIKIVDFGNDTEAYAALEAGHVQMHMDGGTGPSSFLHSSEGKGFQIGIGPLLGPKEGVAVAKKNKTLQRGLAAAFAVMKKEGRIEAALKRWKAFETSVVIKPQVFE